MKVYRVEHPLTGIGPYNHEWKGADDLCDSHRGDEFPTCSEDGFFENNKYLYNKQKWLYAFSSMSKLTEWFGDWMPKFKDAGFVVCEYTVSEVIDGKSLKQLVFDKTKVEERVVLCYH